MLKRQASTSKLSIQSLSHSYVRPSICLPRRTKHAHALLSPAASSSTSLTHPIAQSTPLHTNSHVFLSELGTRKTNPPDSLPDPTPEPDGTEEVDDIEWQIRSGRAIYVLQETLPSFFTTGLITSIDKDSGAPRPEIPLTMPFPLTSLPPFKDYHSDVESIYSPNVRLSYTPPAALPPPLPKTLHIEGSDGTKKKLNRDKSIKINLNVTGVGRVSGASAEWDVSSTYTISPLTGLILTHTVNSIHPSPHVAVYENLRKSFGTVWSDGPRRGEAGVGVGLGLVEWV
ncbi:hypothetical protein BDQ17DRAFT_1429976 [Cyathus striatus]|nr:hypothetical protein BDQ17DRAFT_1429976 [Cyathus striatus]